MRVLVSITGASGSIYGVRLVEELVRAKCEVLLIISDCARPILEFETKYSVEQVEKLASRVYENVDLWAGPSSGTFPLDAMVVAPCSMKTLSAVAHGFEESLTSRAASCILKEGRKLILVIRETPLDLPGIRNMVLAKEAGAVLLPAMPGFYQKPKTVDDLVDFIVGKILDQLRVKHSLYKPWK
jgi:4-hydroxy-3-polyprenylbenzoate decarboxylase